MKTLHCIFDGSPTEQVRDGKDVYLCPVCRRVQILRTDPNTMVQSVTLFQNTLEAAGVCPGVFQQEMFQ
jgi:hypothetical protein